MARFGVLAVGLALVAAVLAAHGSSIQAQPVASIAFPPPRAPADLYAGCNNVALSFPDGTASEMVVDAVTPAGVVESMWRHSAALGRWEGFNPAAPGASDLLTVDYWDAVWLCVAGAAAAPAPGAGAMATPTPQAPPPPAPTATSIPPPAPTATPTVQPAEAGGFSARKTSDYVSGTGSLQVVGEVVNANAFDAEFVKIVGTFFDAAGNVIATDFTYSCLDTIPAGGDSPFDLSVLDPPPGIARYSLQVQGEPSAEPPPSGLQISGVTTNVSELGSYHVIGLVTNNSGVTYEFVKICGALYNGGGDVVRAGFTYSELDTLGPGQSSSFDYMEMDAPQVASHRLWVQGRPK